MLQQTDVERARFNMVEQQIRPWDVLDQRVLDAITRQRREDFVPSQYRALAFADMEIPIGHGERMLQPKIEARMAQELALDPADRVLEIGTGSGYMTALLASLAGHVYSVDIVADFTVAARARLHSHGIANVTLESGDAARGWDARGPYDAIVLTGSVPVLPDAIAASLKVGGRLIAVVGEAPVMQARLVTRAPGGGFGTVVLFETCIPPLRNAQQPERFSF